MSTIKKMGHCAPRGIVAITLLLIVWQWESIFAIGTRSCSCYSFRNIPKNWKDSNEICQENGGTLVSMETEEEYQFINKTIQSLDVGKNEWYIGLKKNKTGDCWTWISGHDMTIVKWVEGQPAGEGDCVKMIKQYRGWGLFDDVRCKRQDTLMSICEYKEAQNCSNVTSATIEIRCFSKIKQITTTKENTMTASFSPATKGRQETTTTARIPTHVTTVQRSSSYSSPPTEKTSSNENEQRTGAFVHATKPEVYTSLSTENEKTKDYVKPTLKKGDANSPLSRSTGSDPFPLVIVTVALGAVLAVSVCLLFFVCYWKRRRNRGDKNEKPKSETTSLPLDAIEQSSNNNQDPEDGGLTEGVQLFSQNGGESYVSYAVIHNNLTKQNEGTTASNEPAYASIEDENMMKRSSVKNDPIDAMPAATMNVENSGNSVGGNRSNTKAVYASVDKRKNNNIKNEDQDGKQWPTGQQVVYASVDKSKKSKACAEDVVYAEVGSKKNTDKQQPNQITYAELADFTHDAPQEAAKPAPYQPAEYAVIIGQKQNP